RAEVAHRIGGVALGMRRARNRIEWGAAAARGREYAAQKAAQLVQLVITVAGAAGVIQLAEVCVDEIVPIQRVVVAVVTVLETVGVAAVAGDDPALIDHSTESIEAGVLVARIPIGFASLLDVGEIDTGLRMGAADDGVETEIRVLLQGAAR